MLLLLLLLWPLLPPLVFLPRSLREGEVGEGEKGVEEGERGEEGDRGEEGRERKGERGKGERREGGGRSLPEFEGIDSTNLRLSSVLGPSLSLTGRRTPPAPTEAVVTTDPAPRWCCAAGASASGPRLCPITMRRLLQERERKRGHPSFTHSARDQTTPEHHIKHTTSHYQEQGL